MRAAKPHELTERALPVMTATISKAELEEWLPFRFQEITDPLAAAEPSRGALLQLDSGQYFVVYWGHDSNQLTVRIPEAVEPSFFVSSFLLEVPLPRTRITWTRDGVPLPGPRPVTRRPPRRSSRLRALIVENDSHTLDALRRIPELEDLDLHLIADEVKAIGALAESDYDFILLGIALPKANGMKVLEFLLATRPGTIERVIVLADLGVQEQIRARFPMVAEMLSKPIHPGRLVAAVRRRLAATQRLNGDQDYSVEPQVS